MPDTRWLDIALHAAPEPDPGTPAYRRHQRARRFLSRLDPTPGQQELLRLYSTAVGAWAHATPWLSEPTSWRPALMPESLVADLRALATPPATGDPLQWARLQVEQYLLAADVRIGASADPERGVVLEVTGHGFAEATVRQWIRWQDMRQTLHVCAWCAKAFEPVRSDSLYCSPSCRSAASRQRRAEARP